MGVLFSDDHGYKLILNKLNREGGQDKSKTLKLIYTETLLLYHQSQILALLCSLVRACDMLDLDRYRYGYT
jgi:hypothetical protein